jgi:DNA-directed RNA polymerase specialized sigma24 family protein
MRAAELISACAQNRQNIDLWAEFLRRYGGKIKQFINGTCRRARTVDFSSFHRASWGLEMSDLLQSTIVRLIEHDCALMKKFRGTSEDEWLAYLAVITRSVVRNSFMRDRRLRHHDFAGARALGYLGSRWPALTENAGMGEPVDRGLLAKEVIYLCERAIRAKAGKNTDRDLLIFHLHFSQDLSINEIAKCWGVRLSRKGVQKVINRLLDSVASVVAARSFSSTNSTTIGSRGLNRIPPRVNAA